MDYRKIVFGVGSVLIVLSIMVIAVKSRGPGDGARASSPTAKELYRQAVELREDGRLLEAREIFRQLLREHPDMEQISSVQEELEEVNMDLIFSTKQLPGKTVVHTVKSGDTLGKLAKQYGTTIELIKQSNNLKSNVIRVGQKLRIWTGEFNIFIDKSQNILILKDGNEVVKVYTVSTGENNSTPVGDFKIKSKLVDPVWFNKGVVVPPDSPANVLGARWLGFDLPGYGIHGTIEPDTIGRQVTAGCVRMRNEEVKELYSLIPMETDVTIVD